MHGCFPNANTVEKVLISDITNHPEKYSGKLIEVEAVLYVGFEAIFLSDSERSREKEIWFEYADVDKKEFVSRGFDLFSRTFTNIDSINEYAIHPVMSVCVIGKFEHTYNLNQGFGHLSAYRSRIIIERFLKAIPYEKEKAEPAEHPK